MQAQLRIINSAIVFFFTLAVASLLSTIFGVPICIGVYGFFMGIGTGVISVYWKRDAEKRNKTILDEKELF